LGIFLLWKLLSSPCLGKNKEDADGACLPAMSLEQS
jgi:hypothetical protein